MFEKSYFDAYASSPQGWEAGLQRRRYFYRGIARALFRHAPGAQTVAEFGCGLGMFAFHLLSQRPGLRLDTFDVSPYAAGVAKAKLAVFANASVDVGNAEEPALPATTYDAVMSLDVVEHLHNPERLLAAAHRVLKPSGLLIFSTPNPASFGARIKHRRAGSLTPQEVPLAQRWFADRDDTHINVRSMAAWRHACDAAGFVRVRDGTDFLWDTPYFPRVMESLQKLVLNGGQRLLIPYFSFLPWALGENYIGVWRKVPVAPGTTP